MLSNVLHVPQFHHNLLSIHKLAKDTDCEVVFKPESCVITSTKTKDVLGVGKMNQGLYYLSFDVPMTSGKAMSGQASKQVKMPGDSPTAVSTYSLWHKRLGHASLSKMKRIPELKLCTEQHMDQVCLTCPMAKMTRLPFPVSTSHASKRFDLVHTDIWGPYKIITRGKFKYFLTLVDDFSRMTWVYLLEKKSDYLDTMLKFENFIQTQFEGSFKVIRSDNALEFADKACENYFSSKGVIHQLSCPYTPQQNARVKRKHRQVLEVARALRFQSGLSLGYWGECVLTATHLINRLPNAAINFEVPYVKLTGLAVDYNELKAFGCLAVAYNHSHGTDKFASRGIPCAFVGYPCGTKGYRLLNLSNMQVLISRHVTFNENVFPLNQNTAKPYMSPLPVQMPHTSVQILDDDLLAEETPLSGNSDAGEDVDGEEEQSTEFPEPPEIPEEPRRTSRVSKKPAWMSDFVTSSNANNAQGLSIAAVTSQIVSQSYQCFLAAIIPQVDPVHFNQAVKSQHWIDAMNVELDALEANETWEITTLPPNRKAIGCRWVFKTKFKADGSIEKYKARLVILGYKQTYGIDYVETFAPVAKMTTVRALLAVAAMKDWEVHQMDVSNAFLNGELEEVVYMLMPQGYTKLGSRIGTSGAYENVAAEKQLVCRLKKAIYGLRQASRRWHHKLSVTLISIGFQHSKADYSLYSKITGEVITLVLIYVDDLLISGNSLSAVNDLKNVLSSHFRMKDLGEVNYFLGLEIDRSQAGIFMSQKKYVMDMIKEFGMSNATSLKLPMDTHMSLTPDKGEPLDDPQPYQRLLGKLIYLTITRPDLSFPVHHLAQFMQKPTNVHMQAAKRILRYLIGNPEQGILLASSSAAELTAYCDSDWASCPTTRKSTSGYCVLLGNSPVSWKTKKQSVVARSTAEAEYRAMALACCEVTWLSSLLKDMGLTNLPPTIIKSDNQAALAIAANPVLHERTKHVEIDCHFIRDKITEGAVQAVHVPFHAQVADILTKQLSVKQHKYLLSKFGVSSSNSTPLEGE